MGILETLLIYFSGWILFVICYYIYNIYIEQYKHYKNKKLVIYNGIKYGIFSWAAILFFAFFITIGGICCGLFVLDEKITKKLEE